MVSRLPSLRDIPAVIFLVTAIVLTVLSFFGKIPEATLIPAILVVLSMLATNEIILVASAYDIKKEVRKVRTDFEQKFSDGSKIISLSQDSKDDWIMAWADFKGTMCSFNPSFTRSSEVQSRYDEVINEIFVPRYINHEFKTANYLFFIGDDVGTRQFELFKDHVKKIVKKAPIATKKIKVKTINLPASSYEFYVTEKWGKKYFVLALRVNPLERIAGLPLRMFAGWDDKIWDALNTEFAKLWSDNRCNEILIS